MSSQRKFYRSVVQIEILSEEPFDYASVSDIDLAISSCDHCCDGLVTDLVVNEEVDGVRMAELLIEHESDPEFFGLTADGEDDLGDDGCGGQRWATDE